MTFIDTVFSFSNPPGSLVYHITLAMALAIIFSLAQIYRKNFYGAIATRWVFASGSLLLLRALVLAVAGLSWLNVIESETLLPALERFSSLSGLLVIAWANFLPSTKTSAWILVIGSFFNLIIVFLAPFYFNSGGGGIPFNHTMVDAAWSFSILLVSFGAAVLILSSRPTGWENAFAPFGIVGIGILLHISIGPSTADSPGFVFIAEMAAYPLVAIAATKKMANLQVGETIQPERLKSASTSPAQLAYLEVATDLATTPPPSDWDQFAHQAVEILGRGMKLEFCALYSSSDKRGQLEVASGFILKRKSHLPPATYARKLTPQIADALGRGEMLQLEKHSSKNELKNLSSEVGYKGNHPLYFFPLKVGRNILGGFLSTSPFSHEPFSRLNQSQFNEIISILAFRIEEWSYLEKPDDPLAERSEGMDGMAHIQELEQENRRLENALESLYQRVEADEVENTRSLMTSHATDQKEIAHLNSEIEKMRSKLERIDGKRTKEDIERLTNERQLALQELAELRSSMAMTERMANEEPENRAALVPDGGAFVALAQELRQPMASIMGFSDLLLHESIGLKGSAPHPFLERIRNASQRMVTLLNELMQLGSGEKRILTLARQPVNLVECLEEAVTLLSEPMRAKRIILRMDIPEENPALIGDDDAIVQILFHLLAHAIEVSKDEGEIYISSKEHEAEEHEFLMFSVSNVGRDNGFEHMDHNTTMGTEIDDAVSSTNASIANVDQLLEMLGGRLWPDRAEGNGSRYTVLLPIAEVSSPA